MTGRVVCGILLAMLVPMTSITASADGPIASSSFVGFEDPLSEGGTWVALTSLWPGTGRVQKNDGAYPDPNTYTPTSTPACPNGHAGAWNTATMPADQYSEIVVGHVGSTNSNVGPIVRVQTSGPSVDSHWLWWASQPGGVNGLYRIDANGSSYSYDQVVTTSGVADGDRLRLIARGPVLYGLKNGVRQFIFNPEAASFRYPTGQAGILTYVGNCVREDSKIASWSAGAAPASSGTWASTNFAGTENPLDEGDRWYPLPGTAGFRKQDGLAIAENGGHNAEGAWGITPPAKQYSQVTLGTVGSPGGGQMGGGPIVRIDRSAHGLTGWLLFLWSDNPTLSGIYKLTSDASGNPIFTAMKYFTPTIVTGDRWGLMADGNVLTVSLNGTAQFTYTTDGSYPSGDVGIEAYTPAFTFAGWEGGAIPVDSQPPTAPTNLGATAAGSSQVNLAWTASTDNVGVTGYQVERCQGSGCSTFAQIATVTGIAYSDTGLAAGTSYSYRVRATDAAGNLSPYSNVASATTSGAAAATHFVMATNASPTAGSAFSFTVTAQDDAGNIATSYAGTVHFTSTDTSAGVVLPPDAQLTNGSGTFSATLIKAGAQNITATDTATATIVGWLHVTVSAASASTMTLNAPSRATALQAFNVTVTLKDQFGNVATGYRGTIHFSSSDPLATLPPNYTFAGSDAGVHQFAVTLATPPSQTITVADVANTSLGTTSPAITVVLPLLP
jgi:chitodextrinase